MNVKNILEGWENYIIPDAIIDQEAKERAEHCKDCKFAKRGRFTSMLKDYRIYEIQGLYCQKCKGCPLSAKVRSKNEKCPIEKW